MRGLYFDWLSKIWMVWLQLKEVGRSLVQSSWDFALDFQKITCQSNLVDSAMTFLPCFRYDPIQPRCFTLANASSLGCRCTWLLVWGGVVDPNVTLTVAPTGSPIPRLMQSHSHTFTSSSTMPSFDWMRHSMMEIQPRKVPVADFVLAKNSHSFQWADFKHKYLEKTV